MHTNITDPVTAAGSILRIVTTGVQLATSLQMYMELVREADNELHDIAFDVNATAAALKQLHSIIDKDRDRQGDDAAAAVFKDDGIREVETLALKCHAIYSNVALLILRASHSDNGGTSGGRKNGTLAADDAAAVLDPTALRPLTFMGKLQWPWLRPRILRCRKQLNWLKVSLLFTLQMANIAQWQMSGKHRGEISQEMELSQQTAKQLQDRRIMMLRSLAANKVEGQDQLVPQHSNSTTSDTESVHGDVYSMSRQKAKKDNTSVSGLNDDGGSHMNEPGENNETSCSVPGTKDGTADTDTDLTTPPSFIVQSRLKIPNAARELTGVLDRSLASNPSPTLPNSFRQKSAPALEEPVIRRNNPSQRQLSPGPAADYRTSQSSVVIDKLPSHLNHWADRVFGRQKKYHNDGQSTSLEAYIAEDGGQGVPLKIPFGHERLSFGLRKVLKDWHGDQWTNYLAAGAATRLAIDGISEAARKASHHDKTCLAFKEYGPRDRRMPFLLVFFSLEKAKDPITLRLDGRRYVIPFAACQTLQDMEQRIREVCFNSDAYESFLPLIDAKHYELADQSNNILLPSFLIESLKPGIELTLVPPRSSISPLPDHSRRPSSIPGPRGGGHDPSPPGRAERGGFATPMLRRANSIPVLFAMEPLPPEPLPPEGTRPSVAFQLGRAARRAGAWVGDALRAAPLPFLGWNKKGNYRPSEQFVYAREPGEPLVLVHDTMFHMWRRRRHRVASQHVAFDFAVSLPSDAVCSPALRDATRSLPDIHTGNCFTILDGDPLPYANSAPDVRIPPSECRPSPPLESCSNIASAADSPTALADGRVSDDEASGDDLNLDVLDFGLEISKGGMSIDEWLERMTNLSHVAHGADHA